MGRTSQHWLHDAKVAGAIRAWVAEARVGDGAANKGYLDSPVNRIVSIDRTSVRGRRRRKATKAEPSSRPGVGRSRRTGQGCAKRTAEGGLALTRP